MPRPRIPLPALLTAASLLLLPAAAHAAAPFAGASPRITPLPVPAGAAIVGSDGDRQLILGQVAEAGTSFSAFDVVTGRSTPIAMPDAAAKQCTVAMGSGRVAAVCEGVGWGWTLYVRDAAEPGWTPVALPPTADAGDFRVLGVGRAWASVSISGYHYSGRQSLVAIDGPPAWTMVDALGARRIPDLDAPQGSRLLCASLARPSSDGAADPYEVTDSYGLLQYSRPWAVETGTGKTRQVRLHRCGSRKVTVVCRVDCGPPRLAGHTLAWTKGARQYVRDLRTGRTTRVVVPGHDISMMLLGDRVIVVEGQLGAAPLAVGRLRR